MRDVLINLDVVWMYEPINCRILDALGTDICNTLSWMWDGIGCTLSLEIVPMASEETSENEVRARPCNLAG